MWKVYAASWTVCETMNDSLKGFQKRIGYEFKNPSILETALTHSSYANEHDCESNERMEFLGDSILNFLVSEKLFFTGKSEGEMTQLRAKTVSRKPLALAVERLGAMALLRLGEGAKKEERVTEKFKSDIFEAVVGAVYLDSGSLRKCSEFIFSQLKSTGGEVDYKSALQEFVQKRKLGEIAYRTNQIESCAAPQFCSEVLIADKPYAKGYGCRKKDAEKEAACNAYNILTQTAGKIN